MDGRGLAWRGVAGLASFSHDGAEGHSVGEHFLHEVLRLHRDPRRVAGDDARHRRVLLEVLTVAGLLGGREREKGGKRSKTDGLSVSRFVMVSLKVPSFTPSSSSLHFSLSPISRFVMLSSGTRSFINSSLTWHFLQVQKSSSLAACSQ